jgi:uncharacterized membrane protein
MSLTLLPTLAYSAYFLAVDLTWIYFAVTPLYQQTLQANFRSLNNATDIGIALSVYIILLGGNVLLNMDALSTQKNVTTALLYGALYGFVVYGVYSGTNYVVFPQWSITLLLTDILWGAFLCGSSLALLAYLLKI